MSKQVWLIGKSFVMEPFLGGKLLGELGKDYKLTDDTEIIPYTQKQFDALMKDHYELNGQYPDQ